MKQIINEKFCENSITKGALFICAFGYEKRSLYLFKKIKENLDYNDILVFYFDDFDDLVKIEKLKEIGVQCIKTKYNSENFVQNTILQFIDEKIKRHRKFEVHIDYSSMPRNWYYNLPMLLNYKDIRVYFWYVIGEYAADYMAYPTAGIDKYVVIGKPSLRLEGKRIHVFGLSYDFVRTKALISEIDPSCYITCNAYDKNNIGRGDNVNILNKQIISKAINELSFCFNDFSFMFSKLCEIAIEYSARGSVIFVPDGPKPLIFAMSLVAVYLNKEGISCLHIYRNEQCKSIVNVDPTDMVTGFSILN